MLILAFVTISSINGFGLFSKANQVKNMYDNSYEEDEISSVTGALHNYLHVDTNGTTTGDSELPNTQNQDGVAQVGVGKNATYYNSLQAAIDAVPATNVATPVILLKDTTESVLIAENKNVNLDLNGKTLTAGTVSTDAIALINKAGYNTEGVSNFVMALINSRNVYNNRWNNRSSNFKHRFGLRLVFGYVQLSVYVR